ncbi:MAG TPA: proline dehydrogenase, partial [Thermoanaerobaculia bacterium]
MSAFNRLLVTGLPAVPKPIVGRVASRYVAGEELADAVRVIRDLNQQGAMATVDVLGEEVSERGKATAAVEEYLRAFEAIDR